MIFLRDCKVNLSDDDKFFVIYYFLELSQAIIRDFGDDFSKRLAKVILDTVDWFYILKTWSLQGFQVCPQLLHLFTVLLLPKNPVQKEYPLCPAVILVEPHLGLFISCLSRSSCASTCTLNYNAIQCPSFSLNKLLLFRQQFVKEY